MFNKNAAGPPWFKPAFASELLAKRARSAQKDRDGRPESNAIKATPSSLTTEMKRYEM